MKFLCVALDQKIFVFLWAPKPYQKFMKFKVRFYHDLRQLDCDACAQEFSVPHDPIMVDLRVNEDETLKLTFATLSGV